MSRRPTLRHFASYLRPHLLIWLAVFVLGLLGTVAGLLYPLFAQFLIDRILLDGQTRWLWPAAGGIVLFTLLGMLAGGLSRYLYTLATARTLYRMRLDVFQHLQRVPRQFYTYTRLGDLIARLNSDLVEVQSGLTDTFLQLSFSLLSLLLALGFMLWLDWRLTLMSLLLMPFLVLAAAAFRSQVARLARGLREHNADVVSFLVESLGANRFIRAHVLEDAEARRLSAYDDRGLQVLLRYQWVSGLASALPNLFLAANGLLVFLYGGHAVIHKAMTLGALVAFTGYQFRFYGPIRSLVGLVLRLQRMQAALNRILELFSIPAERDEGERPETVQGRVEFRNVWFRYEQEHPLLRGVDLQLETGHIVALVGRNGAGKTTIADLLLRLQEPEEGTIWLDGRPLAALAPSAVRRHVALVSSDCPLFHATVAENIGYGLPDAGMKEIEEAARLAGVESFITLLPQGYHTVVGDRGVRLSEGQRQRIGLARAILRDPRIVILDEATSSVDARAEREWQEQLRLWLQQRTVLLIAHRFSSLQAAHRILVLEEGRIVQEGAHEQLMVAAGPYRELYQGNRH